MVYAYVVCVFRVMKDEGYYRSINPSDSWSHECFTFPQLYPWLVFMSSSGTSEAIFNWQLGDY